MQLDRTRIAIRERNLLDIFDLSLRVIASYPKAWLLCLVVVAVPVALINAILVGWMPGMIDEPGEISRYIVSMGLLVFVEAPVASAVITLFFGQAMFMDQPQPKEMWDVLRRYGGNLFWCQMILRGVLPVWLMYLLVPRDSQFGGWEVWCVLLALYLLVLRCVRPFVNEIVLLERNPLRSRGEYEMTIRRRSSSLHNPNAADLFARWLGVALAACVVWSSCFGSVVWAFRLFFLEVNHEFWILHVILPASLWLLVGYVAVVRFLCYLDLRIRREGWEVELIVRAAANELQGSGVRDAR